MAHRVTLIPGDGTGPELAEATRRVLEATGVEFDWDVQDAGSDVMDQNGGNPLPEHVLESIRQSGTALKGPITTPVGGGFRSVNVGLRAALDLYAQVRPCKSYAGVRSRYEDVDLIIVRENTGGPLRRRRVRGGHRGRRRADPTGSRPKGYDKIRRDSGISIKPISETGTRQIVQFAFDYARRNGRRKVTAVHKANIMKFTDGLFLHVAQDVAAENTDIEFDDRIVDNLSMQLVQRPEEYDVLVLPNLYGDIVSDICRGPDRRPRPRAGRELRRERSGLRADPRLAPRSTRARTGSTRWRMLLSGMLMLRHLDETSRGRSARAVRSPT